MLKIFKNIIPEASNKKESKVKIQEKIGNITIFFNNLSSSLMMDLEVFKFKLQNLSKANKTLGFKHLKNNKLADATFRFRFIKKFWPQDYECRYSLAYCLALRGKFTAARLELAQISIENISYQEKITTLLAAINLAESGNEKLEFNIDDIINANFELTIKNDAEIVNSDNDDELVEEPVRTNYGNAETSNHESDSFKRIIKILNDNDSK